MEQEEKSLKWTNQQASARDRTVASNGEEAEAELESAQSQSQFQPQQRELGAGEGFSSVKSDKITTATRLSKNKDTRNSNNNENKRNDSNQQQTDQVTEKRTTTRGYIKLDSSPNGTPTKRAEMLEHPLNLRNNFELMSQHRRAVDNLDEYESSELVNILDQNEDYINEPELIGDFSTMSTRLFTCTDPNCSFWQRAALLSTASNNNNSNNQTMPLNCEQQQQSNLSSRPSSASYKDQLLSCCPSNSKEDSQQQIKPESYNNNPSQSQSSSGICCDNHDQNNNLSFSQQNNSYLSNNRSVPPLQQPTNLLTTTRLSFARRNSSSMVSLPPSYMANMLSPQPAKPRNTVQVSASSSGTTTVTPSPTRINESRVNQDDYPIVNEERWRKQEEKLEASQSKSNSAVNSRKSSVSSFSRPRLPVKNLSTSSLNSAPAEEVAQNCTLCLEFCDELSENKQQQQLKQCEDSNQRPVNDSITSNQPINSVNNDKQKQRKQKQPAKVRRKSSKIEESSGKRREDGPGGEGVLGWKANCTRSTSDNQLTKQSSLNSDDRAAGSNTDGCYGPTKCDGSNAGALEKLAASHGGVAISVTDTSNLSEMKSALSSILKTTNQQRRRRSSTDSTPNTSSEAHSISEVSSSSEEDIEGRDSNGGAGDNYVSVSPLGDAYRRDEPRVGGVGGAASFNYQTPTSRPLSSPSSIVASRSASALSTASTGLQLLAGLKSPVVMSDNNSVASAGSKTTAHLFRLSRQNNKSTTMRNFDGRPMRHHSVNERPQQIYITPPFLQYQHQYQHQHQHQNQHQHQYQQQANSSSSPTSSIGRRVGSHSPSRFNFGG